MWRLLADENFNGKILRALLRRMPDLDVVRAQDTQLYGQDDPDVPRWAAESQRVVLTHDAATMIGYAKKRMISGEPMPGLIAARTNRPIGRVIEDLEILLRAGNPAEMERRILFIPF